MFLPIRDLGAGDRGSTTALIVQRACVRRIRKGQTGRNRRRSEGTHHRAVPRDRAEQRMAAHDWPRPSRARDRLEMALWKLLACAHFSRTRRQRAAPTPRPCTFPQLRCSKARLSSPDGGIRARAGLGAAPQSANFRCGRFFARQDFSCSRTSPWSARTSTPIRKLSQRQAKQFRDGCRRYVFPCGNAAWVSHRVSL